MEDHDAAQAPNGAAEGYMNANEAGAYTRYTPQYLRLLARRREIPHIRVGVSVRFTRADLDRWMAAHRVETSGSTS